MRRTTTTTPVDTRIKVQVLRAFHNDPRIKAKYLRRIRAHVKADELIRGTGWDAEQGRGCAVGCTLNRYDHAAYATELGIPEQLAYLEDGIFENLPTEEAMTWPGRFLAAIPVGADLGKIIPQIVIWQFEDPEHGLSRMPEVQAALRAVCEDLVALYRRELEGVRVTSAEWEAIYERVRAWAVGAWAGVGAGAWAWARAWARAGARAWAGAGAEMYTVLANKLLELLKQAPIPNGGETK